MSSTSVFVFLTCLLAASSTVHGAGTRALKQAFCEQACDAALRRDDSVIRALINEPLCGCVCDDQGSRIMHNAARGSCNVCVDLLRSINCAVDPRDNSRNTPLHLAASACDIPMTNVFLNAGANPNAENSNYQTPLCLAAVPASGDCGAVVQDLVAGGADVCRRCNGLTPFQIATFQNTRTVIRNNGGANC